MRSASTSPSHQSVSEKPSALVVQVPLVDRGERVVRLVIDEAEAPVSLAMPPAIDVRNLTFCYPGNAALVLRDLTLSLDTGARCLLLGANGVGKSTLLRVIAGHHMIGLDNVLVHGRPAFQDTTLAGEVAFLGGPFPFDADISVGEILSARQGIDPARRARMLEVLQVDTRWRMHRVSDGQRRRVQILLDLERSLSVVLLDEVTADLDVLARADLLRFLREESENRQVTILYATHVLDGLVAWGPDDSQDWATHLVFLSPGRLRFFGPMRDAKPLARSLHALCEQWMREDRAGHSRA
jgi:CCR4-NOT complex subunit CAF16